MGSAWTSQISTWSLGFPKLLTENGTLTCFVLWLKLFGLKTNRKTPSKPTNQPKQPKIRKSSTKHQTTPHSKNPQANPKVRGLVSMEMSREAVTSPLCWGHPVCPLSSWLWLTCLGDDSGGELRFVQSHYLYDFAWYLKRENAEVGLSYGSTERDNYAALLKESTLRLTYAFILQDRLFC